MYVEELNRELTGRELDFWRCEDSAGKPLDSVECEMHRRYLLAKKELLQAQAKGVQPSAEKKSEPRKIGRHRPAGGCGCRGKNSG